MNKEKDTIVMSLGGSLLVPDSIDTAFLTKFTDFVREYVESGYRFIIITGGGAPARTYMEAVRDYGKMPQDFVDTIGIHVTRLNAHLVRLFLSDIAHPELILDPDDLEGVTAPVIMGAGWKPGHSSDNDAVIMAEKIDAKTIINLSNATYVYNKDPQKYSDAQIMKTLSWDEYRDIIPSEWESGLNTPFDPVAARGAHELGIKVVIAGPDMENIKKYIQTGEVDGSIIG